MSVVPSKAGVAKPGLPASRRRSADSRMPERRSDIESGKGRGAATDGSACLNFRHGRHGKETGADRRGKQVDPTWIV
ncbi:hypothetical protein Acid7E03_42080 [Acidisoma sp. 7E03]